jgi:hypothetical protein
VESVPRKRRQIGTVTSLLWPFGESDLRLLAKKFCVTRETCALLLITQISRTVPIFFYRLENNVSSEIFYRQQQQTVESMESVTTTRDGATRVLEFRAPPEDDRSTRPSSPIYDVSRCTSHHNQTSTPSHSCVAPFGYLYMRQVHDAFPATVALLNIKFLDVLLVRTHQSRRFRLAVTREGYQMVVGVGAYRPRR